MASMPEARTVVVIEVTNTLRSPSVTGYQRFVRELLAQLQQVGTPDVEVLPVAWDTGLEDFRRLTPAEAERMRTTFAQTTRSAVAATPAAPAPLPVRVANKARRVAVRAAQEPRLRRALVAADHRLPAALRPHARLRVTIPSGAVFMDLEPAWHNPARRDALLPELTARGVKVVTVVADVMPEVYPKWFDTRVAGLFRVWLHAHLASTSLALAISADTASELAAVATRDGFDVPPTQVIPMGADFAQPEVARPVELPAAMGRFLLVVGTVEPRKNHALALDLLDRLADDYPDLGLVIVGKKGWLIAEMLERIHGHPLWEQRLVWMSGIGDDQLTWLYEHAFLAIAPSLSEGLGLPVMEALRHGVPTVSSTGGALPEAGGDVAEYAAPDDPATWEKLLRAHLDDPAHHARARARAVAHEPSSWKATGVAVRQALSALTAGTRS
jgi:glycosyltransferase involved in cell wall biosynthesis